MCKRRLENLVVISLAALVAVALTLLLPMAQRAVTAILNSPETDHRGTSLFTGWSDRVHENRDFGLVTRFSTSKLQAYEPLS
jgi:hypothetical protein